MARGSSAFGQGLADQSEWRRQHMARDSFGRSWRVNVEKESGYPIRSLPAGWSDPLPTPDKYITVGRDGYGGISIGFDQWITDQDAALGTWWGTVDGLGEAQHGMAYNPAKARALDAGELELPVGDIHAWVIRQGGPKPQPEPAVLRLAKDGNRHLLGLEPMPCSVKDYMTWLQAGEGSVEEQDPEFAAFVATKPSWSKFLGWCRAHGSSAQEASQRWNALKEKKVEVA